MSYILFKEEGQSFRKLPLLDTCCISRIYSSYTFPNIYLEYGYSALQATFHIYIYEDSYKHLFATEEIFLCDKYNVETNIWTGKAKINLNDFIHLFNNNNRRDICLRFNFNALHIPVIHSLQNLSICTIGNNLRKHEDIQQLPIPKSLKNNFKNTFLEVSKSQNSLKSWFFSNMDTKDPLFYFGLLGTHKQLDIHKLIHNKSVCNMLEIEYIKPEDEYIILRIDITNYGYVLINIIDYIKTKVFKCRGHKNYNTKAKLIIISDYAPEILFDTLKEKEWILNNIYVVKKEKKILPPESFVDLTPICFFCKQHIYYEKEILFEDILCHRRQCFIGRWVEALNSPKCTNKKALTEHLRILKNRYR